MKDHATDLQLIEVSLRQSKPVVCCNVKMHQNVTERRTIAWLWTPTYTHTDTHTYTELQTHTHRNETDTHIY